MVIARLAQYPSAGLLALVMLVSVATAAEPEPTIGWQDLRPALAEGDDPFADLPDEQLDALRALVRSRALEARGFPVTDAIRQYRAGLTQQLHAQGVAVDALLGKRDLLIAQRRTAAEAGVAALDGRRVRLGGYLLAAAMQGDLVTDFVLVPAISACSHTPPPPPNQMVHVRPVQPSTLRGHYAPAWVSGTLRLRIEQQSVYLVDGELAVHSAYAIDDATVQ
jgi:hypothetical protein